MTKHIVYKGFCIDKTKNGYRVSKETDKQIHTHLLNLNPADKLIDNVIAKRIPRRCGIYYLQSHIRMSQDETYIRHIQDYIEVKVNRTKEKYYRPIRNFRKD